LETIEGDVSYLEVLAKLTRLQQLTDSPALLREVMANPDLPIDSGKLNELPHILGEINVKKENKVVIFSQYKEMTDILHPFLLQYFGGDQNAIRYIAGGVNDKLRAKYQNEFQDDPSVRVCLITTAGNYGLDLFAASYVIAYDELFNPQKMNQIYSRAHRNGQKVPVTAINLRTKGTVEERKAKLLEKKKTMFAAMIDGDDEAFARLFTVQELKGLI
jgi:SNF2 family DNA or RNA helicase